MTKLNKNILYIDTTDFNKVIFVLAQVSSLPCRSSTPRLRLEEQAGGIQRNRSLDSRLRGNGGREVFKLFYKIEPHESYKTLAKLDEFLRKSKILNLKSKIKKIVVNKGPGSYTGVRVGVTIGQALGLAWKVPIKFLDKDKFKKSLGF